MIKEEIFNIVNNMYYECRKSKRYSEDTFEFERNEISNIIKLTNQLYDRTFKANNNYTFITLHPKPREIFATSLDTRICHYILERNLRSTMEQELSDRTFNNRKGKVNTGAVKQVLKDIKEVGNDCWILKLDFKGFFPNADQKIAYREMKELLNKTNCQNKEFLDWLLKITIFAQPQEHCYKKSSDIMWSKIDPEKSLFTKKNQGGAIGFLIWQMAMSAYPNKIIKWIQNNDIKVTMFVDDLLFVTNNKNKILSLIPKIRKLLSQYNIQLNENKFYCQHISKGFEFLGSHIKHNRIYLNNKTINRMFIKLDKLNKLTDKYNYIDKFQSVINCYFGMLKDKNNFGILCNLLEKVNQEWYNWFTFNTIRKCFQLKCSKRNRLVIKYKINLRK